MSATGGPGVRGWWDSLLLGIRFAVAGGRGGWVRAALTAVGVGLGVALLLVAACFPAIRQGRTDRGTGRSTQGQGQVAKSDTTVLTLATNWQFRDSDVYGQLVRADGAHPAVPPGVRSLPGPGQMVVSPALARVLASKDGELLRPRLPYTIVGTIGDQGLLGPAELAYYAGSDTIAGIDTDAFIRVSHFGEPPDNSATSPILLLLILIGFVVLLLPVAVFVGAAVRFGSEGRDRRLAALRLVGADRAMASRIAAGEALAGSLLGLGIGVVLLFVCRLVVPHVELLGVSVFSADVRPTPALAGVIAVAVPLLSVLVTLVALRRVGIEPLGVLRRGRGVRRRVWWRLLIPVIGLAVLFPAANQMRHSTGSPSPYPVAAGVILLLIGVTALLPWLVEATVARMRGGSVSWQLATRRLQLDGGTAARLVSGIAVAVAGTIGLQMLFSGAQGGFVKETGQNPNQVQVVVNLYDTPLSAAQLRATPGVRDARVFTQSTVTDTTNPDRATGLVVGDCASLVLLIAMDHCADGDVFLVADPQSGTQPTDIPPPGTRVLVGDAANSEWTIPATARPAGATTNAGGYRYSGVFATTTALRGVAITHPMSNAYVTADLSNPDTIERIRNAAAAQSPLADVYQVQASRVDSKFAKVRRGLLIGVTAMLLLIGASLLVSMLEQLRERRRLLAMLVAVGTRRRTLGASVLWQATIPMLLGLVLAVATGVGLGAILLAMARSPISIDWANVGEIAGVAALVVLLVTALSLPVLHRLMRTGGLRTE